jgi:hypothetical protein
VLASDAPPPEFTEQSTESTDNKPLIFRIVAPADKARLNGNAVDVEMDINLKVPPTARIVLFLNGQPQEPISNLDITLDQMPPGHYQLYAELQTPGGRKLAATGIVAFELTAAGDDVETP